MTSLETQDIQRILGYLTLGSLEQADLQGVDVGSIREAGGIVSLVGRARDSFQRQQIGGEPIATAVMALGGEEWGRTGVAETDARTSLEDEILSSKILNSKTNQSMESNEVTGILCEIAIRNFNADHIQRATVVLATLLYLKHDSGDVLSGLAVCAARLGRFDAALVLATECLKLPIRLPRAYFIAGLCELARGDRKMAQSLLATAARIARKRPEFRTDLHVTQRLLLVLHLAG